MLPALTDDKTCHHLKIYKEKELLDKLQIVTWECCTCDTSGVLPDKGDIIYTAQQLRDEDTT